MTETNGATNPSGYDPHQIDPRNYETADAYAAALENHLEGCRWRWQMDQADHRGRWQAAEAEAAFQWRQAELDVQAKAREVAQLKFDGWTFGSGMAGTAWWFFLIYMSFWHWLPSIGTSVADTFRESCLKDVAACTAKVKSGEAKESRK